MYRNPNPACTKTLKWRQPIERNVTGSSITIKVHSRWGKKTYLKAKKCSKFHRRDSLHECLFELIIHAIAKAWVFPTSFAVTLSAVAAYHAKSGIQLRTNMYFTIFCFLKSRHAAALNDLNPLCVFKTLLKAHRSPCFRCGWGKENLFTRKVWGFRSPWSSILRPPKHRLMFFLSILSAKEVICSFSSLEWKQDPGNL